MTFFKIEDQLPPKNTLVWVKRISNKIEDEPVYLAMRNGQEISNNPDSSTNCHWRGISRECLPYEQDTHTGFSFNSSFSDVTVKEWAYVEFNP